MAIGIGDLPIENGDFPVRYVNVYQRLPTSSLDIKKMTKNTSQVHQKRGERPQKFIRSTGQQMIELIALGMVVSFQLAIVETGFQCGLSANQS